MAVAEIFLKVFLEGLFKILISQELLNYALRENFHDLLIKWRTMLKQIDAVLEDAEEKQMRTDQRSVQVWLEHLEDLAYDMDDILDEISTEALRQNVLKESRAGTSKVRALMHTSITHLNPSTLVSDFRMRSKMDKITKRLKDLFDRKIGLGLQMQNADAVHATRPPQRPPSSCLIHEPRVCGRDEDQKAIIELLLSDQSNNGTFGVVPIVGMGGVGKTTLAQMVYNSKVTECFEMKGWVCVSENFNIMEVTKAILESITDEPCNLFSLNQVQKQLKEALTGKKFLIVLDDFWNEHHGDWSSLKCPFNYGALGSKVIVTTRHRNVACMMTGTDKYHPLKELSESDCWSVFAQLAFENRSIDESSNLVSLGQKIAKKCGGLPLAARTLGGLLRCKMRDAEWEEVLNSRLWDLPDGSSDILPALRISYYHLPSHLKKCFGYCSVLPKGYEFEWIELVYLWMAKGLIQKPTGHKQMEELGYEYFCELFSRSFFQPSSNVGVSQFVMHDVVNELAQFVARRICFRMEEKLENNQRDEIITKARYSSYTRGRYDGIKKFKAFEKAKNIRSFLPFGTRDQGTNWSTSHLTNVVPLHLLPKLRRLRVLSLRNYLISELSSLIGDLKHVRFLDLSGALIVTLPESIGTLYNLQTLLLTCCKNLSKLPTNMSNLISLRHLDVTGADSLQEMPPKIGKLTSLQTLSNFIVSQDQGSTINELGNLIHLSGTLCISGLENVTGAMDATRANLNNKKGLYALLMKWSNSSDNSHNGSTESKVLDMLKPHENLQELTVSGYHGVAFPTWVGSTFFCDIVSLKLQNCEQCISLPPLGQLPLLKKLYIQGMKAVKNFGPEFYGSGCSNPFPTLQILTLEDMPEWEDWSPFGVEEGARAFVHLSELSIKRCPKLLGTLPSNLPCLINLEIEECPLLVVAWVPIPRPTELNEVRNTLHFDSLISLSLKDVSFPDIGVEQGQTKESARGVFGTLLDFFIKFLKCGLRKLGEIRNPSSTTGDEVVMENARYSYLSSLTSLRVENIQGLTSLPNWFFQGLPRLQDLFIVGCKDLTSLWKKEVGVQHRLRAVQRLVIEHCPQLISLFEEEEEGHEQLNPQEELPHGSDNLRSLKILVIHNCPSLISLPKTGLSSTLAHLDIYNCDSLQSLPELNSLRFLKVFKCSSLTYLSCSTTELSPFLETLWIHDCGNLESLLTEEGMKINCPCLQAFMVWNCKRLKSLPDVMQNNHNGVCPGYRGALHIWDCENLESIPEGWFSATNLTELFNTGCKKLKALPQHASNNTHNHLTCLQDLGIDSCGAGLVSYVLKEESFSYFTNLTGLYLDSVDMGNKPPSEWGLYRLSSLRDLVLVGYDWPSFPPEEKGDAMMSWLPHSLNELEIGVFPNLVKLSCKNFQNLPSLNKLTIYRCKKLTTITELGQLPSLSELQIKDCPKLASFSSANEKGLRPPPSLLRLEIKMNCPKLKQRCEKGKGKYWPLISHIPEVVIEDGDEFLSYAMACMFGEG